jgi:hypothetical protein
MLGMGRPGIGGFVDRDASKASSALPLALGDSWLVIRAELAAISAPNSGFPSGVLALPAPLLLSHRRYFLLIWSVAASFRGRRDWRDESAARRDELVAAVWWQETIALCENFT